jgi:hypothetical protein
MTTTFQKRQKEMKRLDKAREKAARRAQRKLDKRSENDTSTGDPDVDHIQLGPQPPSPDDIDPQGGAS